MKLGRRALLGGAGLLALGVGGLTGRRLWLSGNSIRADRRC